MAASLTLQLTGRFVALDAGGHEIGGVPIRGQAILAYLARRSGHVAPRAELATLFWGDRAEEQARASLRQELSLLRRALPEGALIADRSEVRLDPGVVLTAPPEPGAPLLDGFSCPGAGFEDWLRDERQRDAAARTAALMAEAAAALDAGDISTARAAAQQAMALDPDSEAALRLAMRAEFAAGDRGTALALHARFTERLRAELDAAPAIETESLAREIRAGSEAAPVRVAPAPPGGHAPVVAVLPFDYLALEPSDMLADGIVDEITAALSRNRDFHVIARQSAFALRDLRPGIREAAMRLGADYVVEGTVKRVGERVRITVDLAGADGVTLWSRRFDDRLDDLFDLQDRIAEQVAGQVSPTLRSAEITRAIRQPLEKRSAYDMLLSGYPLFWSHRKDDNLKALRQFSAAVKLDPDNVTAMAMTAWCHAQQVAYIWTDDPVGERRQAADWAQRAAQSPRAAENAPALVAIGAALTLTTTDRRPPRAFLDRALMIDPNNAWGWMRSGWLSCLFNEPEPALAAFTRAEKLSPLDPFLFNVLMGRANAMLKLGEIDEAIALVHRGMTLAPGMTWAYRLLIGYYGLKGDKEKGADAVARFLEHYPGMTIRRMLDFMPPSINLMHSAYFDAMRHVGMPEG